MFHDYFFPSSTKKSPFFITLTDILWVPLLAALPVSYHVLWRGCEAERRCVRAASRQALRSRDSNPPRADVSWGPSDVISATACPPPLHLALIHTSFHPLDPLRPAWSKLVQPSQKSLYTNSGNRGVPTLVSWNSCSDKFLLISALVYSGVHSCQPPPCLAEAAIILALLQLHAVFM